MDIPADKNTVQALIHRFKEAGVHFVDDARVYLDPSVTIEDGAVIWPNVVLRGRTHIAARGRNPIRMLAPRYCGWPKCRCEATLCL